MNGVVYALAFVLRIPEMMLNTDMYISTWFAVFAFGQLCIRGSFFDVLSGYNQSQSSAKMYMFHFCIAAAAQYKTLVNTQNVQIKPITLSVTQNVSLSFFWRHIHSNEIYTSHTLFPTHSHTHNLHKECFWPFAFLSNVWSLYKQTACTVNKPHQQTIVFYSQRLLWCVCMLTAMSSWLVNPICLMLSYMKFCMHSI